MAFETFTGKTYLKIDIASNFGLDKKTWSQRIQWFDEHESQLEDMIPQADTPALFAQGVRAWRMVNAGEPTGYMISLDATSSGLQILAAITGDRSAARLCNVIPSFDDNGDDERCDAYTLIYEAMCRVIGDSTTIAREDTKQAIMTSLYSSTAIPKQVFGEGELLLTFYQTMEELAPGAWELNEFFRESWDPALANHCWTLPDGFCVDIKIIKNIYKSAIFDNAPVEIVSKVHGPTDSGRSLGANITHSIDGYIVREVTRRAGYDPKVVEYIRECLAKGANGTKTSRKKDDELLRLAGIANSSGIMSLRVIDHLDEDNIGLVDQAKLTSLLDSLPAKPFTVISNHDCFRCHPNYGNDIRRLYNQMLYEICGSSLLNNILSELFNRKIATSQLDPTIKNEILDSNYALS